MMYHALEVSMAKAAGSFELTLNQRPPTQTLANWLYLELRAAILHGRLKAGIRLPASREFARRHDLSRGTVVRVFERLQDEGYLTSRVGRGTWISAKVAAEAPARKSSVKAPDYVRRIVAEYRKPKPFIGWITRKDRRPFGMSDPALSEFPTEIWGRVAARRARAFRSWLREKDDGRGYKPLREAIAHYLGSSRGVRCAPDQVVMVSGVQQALDLLARLLLTPGDRLWMEDPGYFGASMAFQRVGAEIVPVPVDEHGLSVSEGIKLCPKARGVFLTPAHQYPLGMTMPLSRRMEVLEWASRADAFVIEDDYDSEYRFNGPSIPSMQGMDHNGNVIFIGTFTKVLFPSLRLGYVVLPSALVDTFVSFRRGVDLRALSLDQAILCDFIEGGHLGRHLRRMRNLYAGRLEALKEGGRRYLTGLLDISAAAAGLYTVAHLRNRMTSRQAEAAAAGRNIETRALDRFTLQRPDPRGLLLGFAAFDEKAILRALPSLAEALSPI
jgi:GntR family transcriptional regulator / MocR family aminotransferase